MNNTLAQIFIIAEAVCLAIFAFPPFHFRPKKIVKE